jgi:ligand-binding SRPBCC domain-containing protein
MRSANQIYIEKAEDGFRLWSELWLPRAPEDVFDFFADARNLEELTPPWVHFRVATKGEIEMVEGTEIDYSLRIRGLPVRWRSRITDWQPPFTFVDEQVRGPYRRWVHEHRFEPLDGGTLAVDHVSYSVLGGGPINSLLVSPDLRRIFTYRSGRLTERFGGLVCSVAAAP